MGNDGKPRFLSNNAGGILGGISTGQPMVCRFAVKPTSSILTPRKTVDRNGSNTEVVTKGRHDPVRGHSRGAGRGSNDGDRPCGSLPAPSRPMRRLSQTPLKGTTPDRQTQTHPARLFHQP